MSVKKKVGDNQKNVKIASRKKRRGPYKKYNTFGSVMTIPKRTKYDWRVKREKSQQIIPTQIQSVPLQSENHGSKTITEIKDLTNGEQNCKESLSDNVGIAEALEPIKMDYQETPPNDQESSNNIDIIVIDEYANRTNNDLPNNLASNPRTIPKHHLINNLLVMAIKWRRNITHTVAQDIANLLNIFSTTAGAKTSKYYWKTIIDRYSHNITTHYICIQCGNYLGSESNCSSNCNNCLTKFDPKSNEGSFLHLPLTDQLRELFETTDAHNLYSLSRRKENKYAIEDIFDGKMYKKQVIHDDMISINYSVDGAPIFESSNTSIYPVLCSINELNPFERRNHIMLSSIWFGSGKPKDMNGYLRPFTDEAKKLLDKGFTYLYKGQIYRKRVVTLMGVCDSVARPLVQCVKQFNGEYGCGLCLHPGKRVSKGNGFTRAYPIVNGNFFGEGLRTHNQTLTHAKKKNVEDRKGVKKLSILCEIPNYNIIYNLDVDWMHCVGLGVVRQFADLWFSSLNKDEKFYFGDILESANSFITSFLPTSYFSRTPRPLTDRTHWKAHEWIIFLLAYSLPLLKIYFSKTYVDHWALLVDGISILIKRSIMKSELTYANQCLQKFVQGVQELYGEKFMSFNVHLLTHLAISVENWGPLWTHSAFIYEDFNQTLENCVKSPNGVIIQICDSFRLKCVIDRLYNLCKNDLSYQQKNYLDRLMNYKLVKNNTVKECKILGRKTLMKSLSMDQLLALRRLNIVVDSNTHIFTYARCKIHREIVTSAKYKREKKRINFNVMLTNGKIFEIQHFLNLKTRSGEDNYLIGYYYVIKNNESFIHGRKLSHFIVLDKKIPILAAVKVEMIKEKVMIFKMSKLKLIVAYVHVCSSELLT
ncbi:uncharacterized protein LOC123273770 [Cotesia glomerata]|uniref:uncharacterized protein LOC123273770 n=1 Tax=Cotesia glomerata TaxID=32391 RepID=UPI001D00BFF2|nr:uncharacterized protein LOC123273770 [Cotesia glomerata]